MIVEMRTYDYRPGTAQKALDRIALGIDERIKLSPLGGLWHTITGRLDRIVHLWPFEDLAERANVRGRFGELTRWPARTGEWMVASETKILIPAPFTPPLTAGMPGPIYEVCTDIYFPGQLKAIHDAWGKALSQPTCAFIGAWHTELGPMNQWVHVWAFTSMEERETRRAQLVPLVREPEVLAKLFLSQESVLCRPASFSPLG